MTRAFYMMAAVAALFAVAATCGIHDLPPATGSINFGFIDVGNLSIEQVDYTVSGNGIVPIEGAISLADPAATPSASIGGLPPGEQYSVAMSATTSDGQEHCFGSAAFDVVAGQAASVMVTLLCTKAEMMRTTVVSGMTDYCPWISSFSSSPSVGYVGGTPISLSVVAGSYYSDPPQIIWAARIGELSNPMASTSDYRCTSPGPETITVTVTDGNCGQSGSLLVTCLAATTDAAADNRGQDGDML